MRGIANAGFREGCCSNALSLPDTNFNLGAMTNSFSSCTKFSEKKESLHMEHQDIEKLRSLYFFIWDSFDIEEIQEIS